MSDNGGDDYMGGDIDYEAAGCVSGHASRFFSSLLIAH